MKNLSNLIRYSDKDAANDGWNSLWPIQVEQLSELFPNISRLETYVLYDVLGGHQSLSHPDQSPNGVHQYVDYLTQKETWEKRKSEEKGRKVRSFSFCSHRNHE